jgi:hypothetical protein
VRKPSDVTLASYEAAAERYRAHWQGLGSPSPLLRFLDLFAELVGSGAQILELGSDDTGWIVHSIDRDVSTTLEEFVGCHDARKVV